MRFLLVLILWFVFIGGLKLYTWQRDAVTRQPVASPIQTEQLRGDWAIELTPTFSAEEDPFALQTEEKGPAPIEVRLNASSIALGAVNVARGDSLRIGNLGELQAGQNEIFIKASPPLNESGLNHGIRVRMLEGEAVLADETIWSNRGSLVAGSVAFTLKSDEEGSHDH